MKMIYLHVGRAKSGTTALQQFFSMNRSLLLEKGIYYPETGIIYDAHHMLAASMMKENPWQLKLDLSADELFAKLREEIDNTSCERVLISSEGLGPILLDKYKHFFDGYSIKIIIYLRRQDQFAESSYNQRVKDGEWNGDIEDYMDFFKKKYNYLRLLNRYAKIFGESNIILHVYEATQMSGGNIFSDFLNILGLPLDSKYMLPEKEINVSLCRDAIETIKLINNIEISSAQRSVISNVLYEVSEIEDVHGKYCESGSMTIDQKHDVLEAHNETNKRVAEKYLNRKSGKLFLEELDKTAGTEAAYSGLGVKYLLKVLSELYHKDKELALNVFTGLVDVNGVKRSDRIYNYGAEEESNSSDASTLKRLLKAFSRL